jgi:hypothetical protein
MRVAVYHRSVPNNKNLEKVDLLKNFSSGVRACGDQVIDVQDHKLIQCDVAMIQGWLGQPPFHTPHLKLRQQIISRSLNTHVATADSNLFLYATPSNPLHYLRFSFNGIFPNTGQYCDDQINPARWTKIKNDLKISIKDYRNTGNHILLCLQRNGGWSMGGFDVQDWTTEVIKKIRLYSDRPIVIRGHPGDKAARDYLNPKNNLCKLKNIPNIRFSNVDASLLDDLKNCWAVINHNSSAVVGAAIEGYPIFVTDSARSQCKEIANTDLSKIETPSLPDRQSWVERLSMLHWNFQELRTGECWQHMRKYV